MWEFCSTLLLSYKARGEPYPPALSMKSEKQVLELSDVTLPFLLKPTRTIMGGINGRMYRYFPGQEYEIDFQTYESIRGSQYADELSN